MPYGDPDPTDPHILVGVVLPAGKEALRDMAYVFAEEFARMGLDGVAILDLFRDPFYAGAHETYRALGPEAVHAIVSECVAVWRRAGVDVQDAPAPPRKDVQWLPWPTSPRGSPMPDRAGDMPSTRRRGE